MLAVDALIYLLNTNIFRCYIPMYVSFISHLTVNWNPLPILTNIVHDQFMMLLDHLFQNGIASANCRLQVMPSSGNLICKMIFLKKEKCNKSEEFLKNKTLKAEKAVRSGGNQMGAWRAYIPVTANVGQLWWLSAKLWFELKEVKRKVDKQLRGSIRKWLPLPHALFAGWSFNGVY